MGNSAEAPYIINVPAYATGNVNIQVPTFLTSLCITTSIGALTYPVNGGIRCRTLGIGVDPSDTQGEIRATNNITAYYSDDRLKTKLGNIEDALHKLSSLSGFHYQANETAQSLGYAVKKEVGVSAQEVLKVLPEAVAPAPISDEYLTVRYERLIPLIIEAIKELKQEIEQIKAGK